MGHASSAFTPLRGVWLSIWRMWGSHRHYSETPTSPMKNPWQNPQQHTHRLFHMQLACETLNFRRNIFKLLQFGHLEIEYAEVQSWQVHSSHKLETVFLPWLTAAAQSRRPTTLLTTLHIHYCYRFQQRWEGNKAKPILPILKCSKIARKKIPVYASIKREILI